MRYLPHTDEDIRQMLSKTGKQKLDDLFETIPMECRRQKDMVLPVPLTEWELDDHMDKLAQTMATRQNSAIYLGAGRYDHYIPHSIAYLTSRSEFLTAYTPYQPEISQGTLQAIYEYQTLCARMLSMDVSNASLYDGASAAAEACLMAARITGKKKMAISRLVHPHIIQVIETYIKPTEHEIIYLPYDANGRTSLDDLTDTGDLAAIVIQSPNFFGCIEDLSTCSQTAHAKATLFITCFTEALAYGILNPPGALGADIACGEGQSLGMAANFGGPGLGILTCNQKYVRSLPGRLVGETRDLDGKRGFVLTLATREQHIRREKATSNICTNSSICALTAAMFMASLGGTGLQQLARQNLDNANYLKSQLTQHGAIMVFDGPTFNEFVVKLPKSKDETKRYKRLLSRRIVPGLLLDKYFPELKGHYLMCVTETKTKQDMDRFVDEVTK